MKQKGEGESLTYDTPSFLFLQTIASYLLK